jgi:tetratricopeptide (TPR) repeat protein
MAWRASLGLIGDYPLLGSGAGSFQYVFMKYQPETLQGWFRQAHNDYLNLLCDIGLMGAVLVLVAVALAVRRILAARRTRRMNRRWMLGAGLAAVLGLLLHALADFNFQIPALAMHWSFILGLTLGLSQSEPSAEGDEEPAEAPPTPVWQRTAVLVSAVALAVLTILPLWRRQAAGLERLALGMDNWQPDTPTRHSADEWRDGVAGLTRVHQLDPTHAESTLALAHYRLLLGDLAAKRAERNPQADGERAQAHRQRAHELLLEHVARVTCDGRSWNWLGYLYGLDERFDTAAAAFARASAVWPSNEVLNERIARRMLKRRDARPIRHERLVLAEQALARLVRAKPNRIEDALAWLFDAGGDLDLLAELAAEAPDGRVRLGELLLARGRLVEAADILHPLTAGRPIPAPGPWRQYAEVMLRTGRFSMARAAALNHVLLSNALQVERSGEEVRQLFHARGLRDQAFEVLLNAARELPPPQRVQLLMPLVRAAHATKRTEEARAVVQDLLDAPLATHDLPRLAGAAERLHDWRSAVTVLSRYAERRPGFDIFMRVGRAYERMRKDRVARIWYQRARQMDPDDAGADAALARVLVRLGEPDEALAILRQTIVRRPQHRGCYLQLARLYEKRQDVEAARRALQTGIEITDDARLHEQLKRLSAENDENGSH